MKTPSLDLLIHELTHLPGIGEKTAQRLAYYILREGDRYSERLARALEGVRTQIRSCPQCFGYTEEVELCHLCSAPDRDSSVICIVEEAMDIEKVENAGVFRGRYHVLGGALAPLDGVGPEDLKIQPLMDRIELGLTGQAPQIRELILALDSDLEGDTTALYLSKLVAEKSVRLTRLAHGVPFGTDIDYIDRRTLGRALENRVEI